ncbi:MAG TPA: DNA gyrase subunit A [Thermoanaerobaculia bacterium]|jgi:DNA gyrase subunit A|nr:DNA gyrase subunit A [Thermoanaerobaculia bacterium]
MADDDTKTPPSPPLEVHIPVDIEEEMKRSYLDYAMSVIIGRALPDVRDGLKPVHRRVLYGMWEAGNRAGRPYKKSARIVGDVMGKYHPHGDSAIYDTVVRMAQDFSLRYPLVDGQGNFGSIDDDPPAAMRYTEVRLSRIAEEMLGDDIDKETVDWAPNYDNSEREPTVLPSALPNLLVNGSAGIAVGMATNVPPHNLGEVVDGLLLLIDEPAADLRRLIEKIPGPDFPTAGAIHGIEGIWHAYATGRGMLQLRAKAHMEPLEKGEREAIVITELPYQVNKKKLIERIAELVRGKKLEGLSDLRDESDRDGIRVVIELKRGVIGEVVLNQLYKLTPMQVTFGIILLAIVDQQPRVLTLKELLERFLDHRKTVVIRRTRFDLRKAEERAHILEGILKALDHLDEVIATIRSSRDPGEARERLMVGFALSDVQAQAILDMRLQRLTGLERDKVVEEYRELMATIERLRAILGSDPLVLEEIKKELLRLKELYGDPRRTEIVQSAGDITIEDMIADEDMVITVTASGYVKRSPLTAYREQQRGGKGRTGMLTKDDDYVEHLFVASAHSYILVFTQSGRVHWLKVHAVPATEPAAKGKAIVNLLQLAPEEKLATTVAVREFRDDASLLFATERGVVKKTELSAYGNPRPSGIIAISIDEGDRLLQVRLAEPGHDVLLATAQGYAIRFPESDVRPMGRDTRGVRGIRLRGDDRVVAMEPLDPLGGPVLAVTAKGFGKRTEVGEYPQQGRGGLGVINVKTGAKTGEVIAVKQVAETDGIVLITQEGKVLRTQAAGVRQTGRGAMGVKLMDLEGEDRLIAAARVAEREEDAELQAQEATDVAPPVDDDLGSGEPDDDEGGDDTPPDTIH